jgi:hypothetical protein
MIGKQHQGEKPYLDNLYVNYRDEDVIYDEETGSMILNESHVWSKLHPFSFEIDKNAIDHLRASNLWREDTNIYDDRDSTYKEIIFRI